MRSMVNNIAATLLILALALPGAAFTDWSNKAGVVEPPISMMLGWNVNEIPGNVTVYYDVNGDRKPDVVFAHPIMAMNSGVKCDAKKIDDEYYWIFTTCPADHAADYFVFKQWTLYKFIGGGWHRVYQHVERNERDRTCRIRQDKQGAGNQDLQGAGESCTGD